MPWYPSLDAMLAQELSIDSVVICSPPLQRQQEAAVALEAGRNVLLERPPATTLTHIGTLLKIAQHARVTLMTAWPARNNTAVDAARGFALKDELLSGQLTWTEDSRAWRPERNWIWQPGGLGVFHVAMDGLSILNRVVAERLAVTAATLLFAPDREAPVAADLTLHGEAGLAIEAHFDVRRNVPRQRMLEIQTAAGPMLLDQGGTTLFRNGRGVPLERDVPYRILYQRFRSLTETGLSDVDVTPLRQVADAHLMGQRIMVGSFDDDPA